MTQILGTALRVERRRTLPCSALRCLAMPLCLMTASVRPALGSLLLIAGITLIVRLARGGFRPAKAAP